MVNSWKSLCLEDVALFAYLSEEERTKLLPFFEALQIAANDAVVSEGQGGRDMYIIVSGQASVRRGDLEVGTLKAGDHFGELALVSGAGRAATIVAISPLELARFSLERFHQLSTQDPTLALAVVRALVSSLGVRLSDMTESVGYLLHERSLPRRVQVTVDVMGRSRKVRTGTALSALLPTEVDGRVVVAGLVDHRAVPLTAPVSADGSLRALTTAHWEGQRIYRLSLALLLVEAAQRVDTSLDVQMDYSIGFAQRVLLPQNSAEKNAELAIKIEAEMRQLAARNLPLRAEYWTVEEAQSHFAECGWAGACETLKTWRNDAVPLSSYGGVYVIQSGPLVDRTGKLKGFSIVAEDDGLLLVYGDEALGKGAQIAPEATDIATRVSQHADALTSEHERWLEALEISSVGEFNRACLQGDVSKLIRVAEGFHEKRIGQIADAIRDRVPFPRVVCIAGPSSSGKSTFIRRLKVQLQVNGIRPVGMGLDNYYVDRHDTPLDRDGKLNYEAFDAIHTGLLQEHLEALLRGERVTTALYDFESGVSLPSGGPDLQLEPRTLLMLEGIHGLNPRLLENLPSESVFRIFICPLAQLPFDRVTRTHASDLRLLRRIVRDRHSRGATAADTIARWPSVRRGERAHIFPHQGNADAIFDASLIYEISVLRGFAERYLLEVSRDRPEYTTAHRLIDLVNRFVTIYPEHVPPTSLLREFVGGSGFEY